MITGMGDTKLPPFPRDSKAPLDTPPAYSERLTPAPREVYLTATSPTPHDANLPSQSSAPLPPLASNPSPLPSTSQGPPPQLTHGWPGPEPPSPPPSHSHSPSEAYPLPPDASSYESSSAYKDKGKGKGKSRSAGGKVARAAGQGMLALVAMPVVATAAALYGSGKLVEGIGRGLSAGPEAVLKAYRKVDAKIKGDAPSAQEDAEAEAREREREWHQYQYQQQQQLQQQQQQQHQYVYQQQQGEWGEAQVVPMKMHMEEGMASRSGSLQMPMKGSLMEDPSIGMARGVGSIQK